MYKKYSPHLFIVILVLLALATGYLGWLLYEADQKAAAERQVYDQYVAESSKELALRRDTIDDLAARLELTSEELNDTRSNLQNEQDRNDAMAEQVSTLAGTVSDLDKLSKTDKELLQKYSKVSFLNEHYVPESIKEIDPKWKYSEDKPNQLHSKVMPFFEKMLEDAKDDGVDLWVVSAYRSFGEQAGLKAAYTVTYGSGANTFSADQGFSEHQLGTTIDFTTSGIGGALEPFGNTAAYQWLLNNAHKYGFTMSYPPNNAYYVFEPWHWRFVGEDLAKDLHDDGAYFYDWEQRKIDQYLLNIFD
jgi:D-alanyl-D-alanine carboxypeptidase